MKRYLAPLAALGVFASIALAGNASAAAIPSGWTCDGSCGSSNAADGVVSMPPNGLGSYQWTSTAGGPSGVGVLPTGSLGKETNGSTLATSVFAANANTALSFYFNYVTSDGSGYADYGWAALFNSDGTLASLLFTARTAPVGSIVPGFGMPPVNATLDPSSAAIIGGGPAWSALGGSSGACYGSGCGYTGWVNASYTIATAGDYFLKIGVVNWSDTLYDTGLAMSGVTVDGKPIDTPEPAALATFGFGALLIGLAAGLRRRYD